MVIIVYHNNYVFLMENSCQEVQTHPSSYEFSINIDYFEQHLEIVSESIEKFYPKINNIEINIYGEKKSLSEDMIFTLCKRLIKHVIIIRVVLSIQHLFSSIDLSHHSVDGFSPDLIFHQICSDFIASRSPASQVLQA